MLVPIVRFFFLSSLSVGRIWFLIAVSVPFEKNKIDKFDVSYISLFGSSECL